MKQRRIYIYVSNDEFALPLAVGNTIQELANQIGVSAATIKTALSNYRKGIIKKSRYIEVYIDEE